MVTKGKYLSRELTIRRSFNATPERLFAAWTEPRTVRQWWGPTGFTAPVCEINLVEGGEYLVCMRSPEGQDYWSKGTYITIDRPWKIEVHDNFVDRYGNIISAESVGLPGEWPSTLLITVELADEKGGTEFTLRHYGLPLEMIESCRSGWNESLDKLAKVLVDRSDVR
jgi:uncharacterized protein YndB with AHSA1/START domain